MQKRTVFAAVFALLALTAHASIMLGGAKDVAVDDHAKSVAAFAVQQLNAKNAFGSSGHELVRVTGYKTQVCCVVLCVGCWGGVCLSPSSLLARGARARTQAHAGQQRSPLTLQHANHTQTKPNRSSPAPTTS